MITFLEKYAFLRLYEEQCVIFILIFRYKKITCSHNDDLGPFYLDIFDAELKSTD